MIIKEADDYSAHSKLERKEMVSLKHFRKEVAELRMFSMLTFMSFMICGCNGECDNNNNINTYCESLCGYETKCYTTIAQCKNNCSKRMSDYSRRWRPFYANLIAGCLNKDSTCKKLVFEGCITQALENVVANPEGSSQFKKCNDRRTECKKSNPSILYDDAICYYMNALDECSMEEAFQCFDLNCDMIEDCMKKFGMWKS